MPYIGRELERGTYLKLDDIRSSFDGNKTIFNLTKGGDPFFPGSPQSIIVSVNGKILEPVTEYGIDSSKIVFATAPTAGHAFFSITLGLPFGVFDNGSIEDGSLTGVKLSNPFNYDGGLLFLNSVTDKVGIRTENPTHDLDVHGDVRIVGILTVGTSSLTLDGSNNKIQVGTALTLSHSDGAIIGNSHLHSTGYDLKDNTRIRLGDSNDFQIYHTTSGTEHNRVESGTKQLRMLSSSQIQLNTGAEHMAKFIADGAVELYHGMGSGTGAEKKFETSTTGATVTGKLVITGDLDVQGTTTTLDTTLTEVDKLEVGANNTTVGVAITQSGTGNALTIDDGTSRVFTVQDGGSVRIGDNTSYSASANGDNLVIGTTAGSHGITVISGNSGATTSGGLFFGDSGSSIAGGIRYHHSDNTMRFRVAGGTRVTFAGTGRLGIGTESPKTQLHAYNGTPSDIGGILVSNMSYSSNQDSPYLIIGTKDWSGAATNWNTFGFQHKIKSDNGGVPRLTIDGASGGTEIELFTFKNGGYLGIGVTNPQGKLHIPDSGEIRLGNDSDLKILHSGALGVIGNVTGDLYIQSNQDGDVGGDIYIRALAGEDSIYCQHDGPVYLYDNGSPKFRTYSEGIQVIGSEGANASILLKADEGDDNNDMYRLIAGNGTSIYLQNYATGAWVSNLIATGDGSVDIRHAGEERFVTDATGITIKNNGGVPQVAIAQTTTTAYSVNGAVAFVNSSNTTAQIQGRTGAASTTGDIIFLCNTVGDESLAILEDGKVRVPDRGSFVVGQGNDLTLKHDTNSTITNITGQLAIENTAGNLSIKASNSTGDIIMRAGGGNSTENAIVAVHHGEVVLSFNGATRLTTTNTGVDITDNLKVAGITTFSGDMNIDSGKTLVLNSNASDPVIKIQGGGPNFIRFASDASGTVDSDSIDLVYRTTPNTIAFRRSSDAAEFLAVDADDGLVTVSNNLNVTGNLDVDGQTDLDDLAVAGVSTFSADVNVGDGSADARILIKKADNNTADHIQFYNGTTRVGEIGCLDDSWLRINQQTSKNIYTPRYIRADGGFFVDSTAKGINGSGNFQGGTIAGASDYDTLLRSDTNDIMNGILTVGGSSVSANEGGQINITYAPNSTLSGSSVAIDQYIDKLRIFEAGGDNRGASIDFTRITGNSAVNEIFSSGLTGVGFTVTHLRSFGIPNGVVAISTSTQAHVPLTVTNSGGHGANTIITKFVGNSDGLDVRNINSGDYQIRIQNVNTGISFYNGGNGMQFLYDGSRKFSCIDAGLSLDDELTFENDDEGLITYDGGRFYKKSGGGIAIRQTSGNQTPIIENNAGTLQGTILHTGNASTELAQFLRSDANDTFTGTLTAGQNGKIAFPDNTTVPDDPTNEQHDYITFGANGSISQVSGRGALMITSSDDSLILANGDIGRNFTNSNINVDPEDIFMLSDGSFHVKTDLQEGFGTEHTLTFSNTGVLTIGSDTVIHTGNASSQLTQFVRSDQSDTMSGVLTISSSTHQKLKLAGSDNPKITLQEGTTDKASIEWSTSGLLDIKNEESGETLRLQSGSNGLKYLIDGSINTVVHTGNASSQLTQYLRSDENDTMDGNLTFASGHVINMHNAGTRDKYRVWTSSSYTIGMDDAMSFGGLNDYAMTFQMNDDNDRGWVFLDAAHTDAEGAMSLTTNGKMNIAHSLRVGYGEDDTTAPGTTGKIDVSGEIYSTAAVVAGRGGGGVAMTINDGHGNANLCFNHKSGVPEQNGASGRIQVNTDTATANAAFMKFELKSAVTGGTGVSCTEVLNLMSNSTAAPFRMGFLTNSPEATFHIQSNHSASDVPTIKISEFRPSIHFEDVSTDATDWQILCDHNDISNGLQFRSGDSSNENKLSHLEYYMDYTGFHIGNSDGDRQRKLVLHAGTAASDTATLYASNGNLHIDCASGHHTYINHYNGNEVRLNYGSGNSGLKLRTQSTGVEITGQLNLGGNMQFTAANPELEMNAGGPRFRVPAANTLTVHTGGTIGSTNDEVLRITSSGCEITGKLGINVAASEANLHIDASAGGPGILVSNAGSTEGDLAVDSDEQIQIGHWDKSTNTYTNRLNVNAAGSIFRIIPAETRIADGTAASPAINFNSDQDTGFFRPASNCFSIATEGKECFRLDADQRLLVGELTDGTLNDQNAMLYVRTEGVQKGLAIRTAGSGTDVMSIWSNKTDAGDGTNDDDVHLVAWRVGSGTALKGSIFFDESDNQVDYNRTSDRRLKENIVDLDNAIDIVKQLKPRKFNFNRSAYSHDLKYAKANTITGFIADEVETIIPQAVTGTKDAVYTEDKPEDDAKKGDIIAQQLDVSHLIPHLTAALKEAITKIETLEAEVAALKAKVG